MSVCAYLVYDIVHMYMFDFLVLNFVSCLNNGYN